MIFTWDQLGLIYGLIYPKHVHISRLVLKAPYFVKKLLVIILFGLISLLVQTAFSSRLGEGGAGVELRIGNEVGGE